MRLARASCNCGVAVSLVCGREALPSPSLLEILSGSPCAVGDRPSDHSDPDACTHGAALAFLGTGGMGSSDQLDDPAEDVSGSASGSTISIAFGTILPQAQTTQQYRVEINSCERTEISFSRAECDKF